jgi:hypothetical protein
VNYIYTVLKLGITRAIVGNDDGKVFHLSLRGDKIYFDDKLAMPLGVLTGKLYILPPYARSARIARPPKMQEVWTKAAADFDALSTPQIGVTEIPLKLESDLESGLEVWCAFDEITKQGFANPVFVPTWASLAAPPHTQEEE